MKKAKKIILMYLWHSLIDEKKKNGCTYQELYQDIPLSQSTIRGILQDFLATRIVMKKNVGPTLRWSLTETGIGTVGDVFPAIEEKNLASRGTLIVLPSVSVSMRVELQKILSLFLYVHIDTKTFLLFDSLPTSLHRKLQQKTQNRALLFENVFISQEEFVSYWFRTSKGSYLLAQRETISELLRKLHRKSPTQTASQKKLLLKTYAEMISACSAESILPDVYYPLELRLTTLSAQMYSRK